MRGGNGALLSVLESSCILLLEIKSGGCGCGCGCDDNSASIDVSSFSRLIAGGVSLEHVVVVGGGGLVLQNRRLFLIISLATLLLRLAFGDMACIGVNGLLVVIV